MNGNRKMKKVAVAGLSAVLCTSLAAGGVIIANHNSNSKTDTDSTQEIASDKYDVEYLKAAVEKAANVVSGNDTKGELFKDETVYALADANGTTNKIIVSDWLKNAGKETSLSDVSNLENITNIKGDETFTQNGDKLTWNTNDTDIFYQGTTEEELPVDVKITYSLDGKEMTPEELVGKSGKLTIKVDYKNNSAQKVTVNGKEQTIYTPFAMVTGMMLPLENFSNVTIDNGTVISDAKSNVVIGIALPGFTDSLGLDSDKLDIPESLTITADVTDFEMGVTLTAATSDFLSKIEIGEVGDLTDLQEKINTLIDSSKQLADGSTELKDGTKTLSDGLAQLQDGAGTLNTGIGTYVDGVDTLASGITSYTDGVSQLTGGVLQLADATGSLTSGVGTLADGVAQATAGADTLNANMGSLTAGANAVVDGVGAVNQGLQSINGAFDTMDGYYNTLLQTIQANQQVLDGLNAAVAANPALGQSLQPAITALSQTVAGQTQIVNGLKASIASGSDLRNGMNTLIATTSSANAGNQSTLIGGATAVAQGSSQIQAGVSSLDAAMQQINSGTQTLNSSVSALPAAIDQLKNGALQINDATPKITSGAGQLTANSQTLKNGAASLATASVQLNDGGKTLLDGATTLSDGMNKFDEEGVQKISALYEQDLKEVVDKLDAVLDCGKEYKSFTGLSDNMSGSVKFIIETDEISK